MKGNVSYECYADIMPTVLDFCGITPPKTVSKSWIPLLKGESTKCHEAIYTSRHCGSGPPGRGADMPSHITVTTDRYTGVFGRSPHKPELYDRRNDPQQAKNLAEGSSELVEKLRVGLGRFMWQQGADEEYIKVYAEGG